MSNVRLASIFIFQKNWNSTMTRIVLSELSESSIDLHQSVKLSCFWSLHGLRKVFEFRWIVVWPLNKTNRNDAYSNLIREWDQRLVQFPILILLHIIVSSKNLRILYFLGNLIPRSFRAHFLTSYDISHMISSCSIRINVISSLGSYFTLEYLHFCWIRAQY